MACGVAPAGPNASESNRALTAVLSVVASTYAVRLAIGHWDCEQKLADRLRRRPQRGDKLRFYGGRRLCPRDQDDGFETFGQYGSELLDVLRELPELAADCFAQRRDRIGCGPLDGAGKPPRAFLQLIERYNGI